MAYFETFKCTDTAGGCQGINHAADKNYRMEECASLLHIQCMALPLLPKSNEFCLFLLYCFFLLLPSDLCRLNFKQVNTWEIRCHCPPRLQNQTDGS